MIWGEQPGDRQDLSRKPFTGSAGQVPRNAMALAGLEESAAEQPPLAHDLFAFCYPP